MQDGVSVFVKEEAKPGVADASLPPMTGTTNSTPVLTTSNDDNNNNNGGGEGEEEEEERGTTKNGADDGGGGCCGNVGDCGASSLPGDTQNGLSSSRTPTLLAFHQQRYSRFLQAYFRYGTEQQAKCIRQAAKLCVIGLGVHKKGQAQNADLVHAMRHFIRHSVLAVEGDAVFVKLVQRARWLWGDEGDVPVDDPRHWPNARCIALHYGLPPETLSQDADADTDPSRAANRQQGQFPPATLMAVVATTSINDGESVRLCLRSYYRCLDEMSWYEEMLGTPCIDSACGIDSATRGRKFFRMWPDGLAFYHGVGLCHAGAEPVAGFPFTLLDLAEATSIGEGQKGLFAAHYVPYGTCFLYCGPAIATKVVEARRNDTAMQESSATFSDVATAFNNGSRISSGDKKKKNSDDGGDGEGTLLGDIPVDDATYALGLGKHGVCFGQGLMRYANHRYNLNRFGNVELCSVMLSVTSEFSSLAAELERRRNGVARSRKKKPLKKGRGASKQKPMGTFPSSAAAKKSGVTLEVKKKRRYRPIIGRRIFLEEHSHFVTIPFFIATTDIEVGQQLLAWTYGEEYDARLERQVVCDGNLVPYSDAEILDARTPPGRWQRYKGDYRYSLGCGDIVWCRQPSPCRWRDPVEELFVVVEASPQCVDCVLLRHITRRCASGRMLLHPHVKPGDEAILFEVCTTKALDLCIIAHVDTVALLLDDIDYCILPKLKRVSASSSLLLCGGGICKCGGGPMCPMYHIIVNGTALRAVTRLVLEAEQKVTATPISGRMWPLMHRRGGATTQYIRERKS